jgi:hypothetical protein
MRRIGSNPVVLRAVETITPYLRDVHCLAIVPEASADIERFVRQTLEPFRPAALEAWDTHRWGFLGWADVREFCAAEGLPRTVDVLDFNQGQVC